MSTANSLRQLDTSVVETPLSAALEYLNPVRQAADQAEQQFVISTFTSTDDNVPKRASMTWPKFAQLLTQHRTLEHKKTTLWSPARYENGVTRAKSNVVEVTQAAFDLDDGTDVATLAFWLGDLEYVISSTYSHTPEHPKLRPVIRLAEPIARGDYDDAWRRINQHLFHGHVDPSTKDAARMFFIPSRSPGSAEPIAIHHPGRPLDWRTLPPLPKLKALPRTEGSGSSNDGSDRRRARIMLEKWRQDLGSQPPNSGRHNRLLQLARAAGGLLGSGLLSQMEIEDALYASCQANGLLDDDGADSVRRAVSDGIENGRVEPWAPDDLPDTWIRSYPIRTHSPLDSHSSATPISSVLTVMSSHDWPEPDPIFGPPPAPSLALDLIPREIADVARDVAERQQAPVDFVVWPLLVSAAGLIGRGAGIRPRAFDDWTERPALWVAQIGPPSSLKTPAQEEGTRGLRRQQERDHELYVRALADWKTDCAVAKQADPKHPDLPPAPTERRCWTADVTIEKLAILLTPEVSRGLTVYRDELAGLILDLDKYHQKGGDRQFYLQAYTGGPYTVDRVQRESLFIPDLLVNVVGGIQPEVARAIFGGGPDDGFAARFLSIWPEADSTWHRVDRWPNRTARQTMDAISDRMAAADWQTELARDDFKPTPYCRLASEGQQLFDQWHEGMMTSLRAGQYPGRLAGRVGKYPGLAARLILVYHLIEWAAGRSPQAAIVTAETVAAVLELVDEYVLPMEQRVYSAYAVPPDAEGGRRIARWLQAATPAPAQFTAREILRRDWAVCRAPRLWLRHWIG